MKIFTKVVWDMATGVILESESYEYSGPVALCGGGGDAPQQTAAANTTQLSNTLAQIASEMNRRQAEAYSLVKPFATSTMTNGLSIYPMLTDASGRMTSEAYAPARGAIKRMYDRYPDIPNGAKIQSLSDLEAARARAVDSALANNAILNENAKMTGAQILNGQQVTSNPLPYYSAALGGNQAVMAMPVKPSPAGGILGGLLGGVTQGFMGF